MKSREVKPLLWKDSSVYILDQTALPEKVHYLVCKEFWQVAEAIRQMRIRGAPLIGVAAAYALALGVWKAKAKSASAMEKELDQISTVLQATRPTAFNLFREVDRMVKQLRKALNLLKKKKSVHAEDLLRFKEHALALAKSLEEEDAQRNLTLSAHGAYLLEDQAKVLTICNTGSLATAGYGTALGVIRRAHEQGKKIHVYACETRPYLQGSRLTCFELSRLGIPYTLVVDSAVGYLFQQGLISTAIAGADRIARNGDTANKIGTYSLASLARSHGVPFYIAAPSTTIDFDIKEGRLIPVEERGEEEVKYFAGVAIAPTEAKVFNPAFDITPSRLISGIITEKGIARYPYIKSLGKWLKQLKREKR